MADYSINAVTRRVVYTGSAGTGPYAFSFEILVQGDIAVYFNAAILTLTTDYTVTINANGTGSVTIVTGTNVPSTPTASDQITIVGSRDIERTTDFVTAGDFRASAINEQLDSQIIMIQQIAEENQRGMRAPTYDPALVADGGVVDMTLPTKASRAGKTLAFDSNGNPVVGEDIGNWRGDWAAAAAYSVRDLVKDASNYNVYRCNTAHTASGTTPISGNADAAKWDLVVDAEYAATQASNAAASASAAASSATASASSASAASTSASNAATSASNASTTYDNFDDRYLGQKSSDPSVDNDGDALLTGALYFNTSNNVMMVYTGSAWVRTTPTTGEQANIDAVTANATNINTVAGIAADVTTTAGISADVTTTAGISANVTTVAGISTDVTTAATNVTDITNFADVYIGPSASDPTQRADASALQAGDLYFNTTVDELRAYSGSQWVAGTAGSFAVQRYNGDGSTVAFTLATAPASENNTQVYVSGVYQQKDTYGVIGTTLTFSAAPPIGTNNIEIVHASLGTATADTLSQILANGNSTGGTDIAMSIGDKITNFESTGINDAATSTAITITSSENVGIGTAAPVARFVVSTGAADQKILLTNEAGLNKIKSTTSDQSTYTTLRYDATDHIFESSDAEVARITSSGRLGLGTASPAVELEIASGQPELRFTDTDGTDQESTFVQAGGTLYLNLQNNTSDGVLRVRGFASGSATDRLLVESSGTVRPGVDNSQQLGAASYRWSTVYAGTGTINTSDAREKQQIADLDDAERRVAVALKGLVKKYKYNDAVELKGDDARIHVGVIAQEVVAAFEAEGLDATRYALLCYDVWDAEPEETDKNGDVINPARDAGERYGIRYDELLAFMIAAL